MRRDERGTILAVGAAGILVAALALPALYYLGLSMTPRPRPAGHQAAPALVRAALWAVNTGGPSMQLEPLSAASFVTLRVCRGFAARRATPQERSRGRDECLRGHSGIASATALADIHMAEQQVEARSFRLALGQMANAAWVSRNWSAEALLDALAATSDFGHGLRGVEAASRGYFGKDPGALRADEAAMLAAMSDDGRLDPWCAPEPARAARGRVLQAMHTNGAIDAAALDVASHVPLALAARPAGPACTP